MSVFDWISQGFQPSGGDQAAILAQQPGFYFRDSWRRAPELSVNGVFVVASADDTMPLLKVQTVMSSVLDRLAPIAEALRQSIDRRGVLDMDAFDDYCRVLLHAAIYTREQRETIEFAHSLRLSAKAIGGLHNKGLLVVGPDSGLEKFVAGLPGHSAVVGDLRKR
jgi:hypothetical protein